MSGSLGKSQSSQRSGSNAYGETNASGFNQGQSTSNQNVWQPQQGALKDMYAGAINQAGVAQNNINQLNPQMMQSMNNLLNPGVNPQMQAYQNSVMQNFNENIMPAISDNASMAGGFGGTRQGVAQGVAGRGANQQMTDMASNLYNQDMNRMIQGLSMAPQIANAGMIPWQNASNIIGGPTVLGNTQATNQGGSKSSGFNRSNSTGYGESKAFDTSGGIGG